MIVDIDKVKPLPLAAHYDVCIAGGGVAGIVLALSLARQQRRVLLLEAGGLDYSDASQDFYRGAITGHSYDALDVARLRFLGGTSNHWGGWCRPLDAYDFDHRGFIDGSGWPIGISDIQPYLPEAQKILEIPELSDDRILEGSKEFLKEVHVHTGPPVLFNEKYRKALNANDAIDVFLNANLVDIALKSEGSGVAAFAFKGYSENASIHNARAAAYVLALGGIENARALLNANKQQPGGLGNDSDLVGRFFMDHPHYNIGYYVLTSKKSQFGKVRRFLAPTPQLMQKESIANANFYIEPIDDLVEKSFVHGAKDAVLDAICGSDTIYEFVRKFRYVHCRVSINGAGTLFVAAEHRPNPRSRVTLDKETDRFGLRRVALNWELTRFDKRTMRIGALEVAKHFARHDVGRMKLFDWVLEDQPNFPGIGDKQRVGGFHHMGTTRMGLSKKDSVVDRNCRIFGIENLYIAGSSVFRTSGHANPTLSIVQLTLRLGDHLARLWASRRD